MSQGRVLVYGGNGALGKVVLKYFKENGFLNVDLIKNEAADANVTVDPAGLLDRAGGPRWRPHSTGRSWTPSLCVAGGWAGGNAASKDFIKNADMQWKQSVWSSAISARLASQFLKPSSLLQLTGAAAATSGTPGMIGYGCAKAAADFSKWTPLEFVAETLHKWTTDRGSRFPSGSFLKFTTNDGQTEITPA
ncbi:Dihydropteridine reductase [Aphelenchoides fujianensis]|nr:Dihydropteridine reductase [Aphelenchoides fujianensis]